MNSISKERPWLKRYSSALRRCTNKNDKSYYRYGAKGIKMLMSKEDFEYLWFRDNAGKMKKASIDRIDPRGNYILDNCRFIELSENSSRRKENMYCKRGHKFDSQNTRILKSGSRECLSCLKIRHREAYLRLLKKLGRKPVRNLSSK